MKKEKEFFFYLDNGFNTYKNNNKNNNNKNRRNKIRLLYNTYTMG